MIRRLLLLGLIISAQATASAELAVIAHPQSELEQISRHDLSRIFLAKTRRLPNGQRAHPAEWQSTELKQAFYRRVADKHEVELRQYWATMIFSGNGRPPKQLGSIDEVIAYVRDTRGAIAYIPRQSVSAAVRILELVD